MEHFNTQHTSNPEEREALPIVFYTAVFTRTGVEKGYPGGVTAFLTRYPHARQNSDLLALSSMSGGELETTLCEIEHEGLDLSACCALADVRLGPLQQCEDIELFTGSMEGDADQRWMARLKPNAMTIHPLEAMARRIDAELRAAGYTVTEGSTEHQTSESAHLTVTFIPAPRKHD